MPVQIVRARPEHIPEVSRIVFEAFKGVQERHRFPLDIPNLEIAGLIMGMFTHRPDCYGVVAMMDGKIVGSNFTLVSDAVSGVGPITVDENYQGRGLGRELMRHIMDWSLANHGPMVRLIQEGFNLTSLSLYTSLGFTVKEPLALMEIFPAEKSDATVRRLNAGDLPACEELCIRVTKVSRKNELAFMIEHGDQSGFVPHGRFKSGRLCAM